MKTEIPYHKWLIRMRIYCEHKRCIKPAERVRNINGRDTVLCSWHAKTRRIMDQYRQWEREKRRQASEPKTETPGDALEAMEAWEYYTP